ncbi:MAG: RnfH family protein [Gammaproteobacteria bacterium]
MGKVLIVYGTAKEQTELELPYLPGETVEGLIVRSKILKSFPEIDLKINKIGIFGNLCELDEEPEVDDRVEIYRPLRIEPKELRRLRAKKT